MPMDLTFAGYQSEASVHTRAGRVFAERLAALCSGEASLALMPDITQQGRASTDLFAMLAANEIGFCYYASSAQAGSVPLLGILDLPFAIHDRAKAFAALDGEVGARLSAEVAARTPFRLLGFWDNGFRHFSNARRPLRRPEDCRGLRMRTLNSQIYQDVLAAVGFTPVVTDAKDLPRVVASGEVDGQENPLTNLLHFGLNAYHPYVTVSAHIFGVALFLCNRTAYENWPADLRHAVDDAARAATLAQRRFAAEDDVTCRAELEKGGTRFVDLTPEERAAFRAAAAPVVQPRIDALDRELALRYLASQDG